MLYSLLKFIIGSGIRLHFRRIETTGLDRLEQKQPTIIIANHTNALTDPLLLGILLKRRIHFYVRGDVFENPAARALFNHLGMMPIFRLKDGREKLSRNENSNGQALQILKNNGAILIFAEGSSDELKLMRPVKKGPFRLAAEAAKLLPQPPLIIPLGINYLEPGQPDTTAWLLSGAPLSWPENLREMPEAKLSLTLMKNASEALQPLTLHAGDAKRAQLAETLLLIRKNSQTQHQSGHFNFHVAQQVLDKLAGCPEAFFQALYKKVASYQHLMEKLGLEEKAFKKISPQERQGMLAGLLLGLPVWLTSLVFHWPVTALAGIIVRKKVTSKDFISSIHILSVTFLNLIWYLLWLLVLSLSWSFTGALLLLLALAACGIISTTLLLPSVHRWRQRARRHAVSQKEKEPFARLLSLRREILDWLQAAG